MILRWSGCVFALCTLMGFCNVFNTHEHSSINMKYVDKTGKIMELQKNSNAKIVLQNVSSFPITGFFEFLSSDKVGNENSLNYITLLVVYNTKTGLILGQCNAERSKSVFNQENQNWKHFEWIVERNFLFCHVYGQKNNTIRFGLNNTSILLQLGNGQSNICIKNLVISHFLDSSKCPPTAPLQSTGINCGCSLLTPSIYSTRYDLPILNDDALSLDEKFKASQVENKNQNEFSFVNSLPSLPSSIAFPLFRPVSSSNSNESDNFKSAVTNIPIESVQNEKFLLDHFKILPILNSKLTKNSNSETADFNIEHPVNKFNFTPLPEVWIRSTHPLFHYNVVEKNSTKLTTKVTNSTEYLNNLRPDIKGTSPPTFVTTNVFSLATKSSFPSIDLVENLQCVPKCEKQGICVSQRNGVNGCQCPDALLGLNCNIKNPCVNVTTCFKYGPQAQCITDVENMAAKAPLQFVEAPHLCFCQDDNSEWTECNELESMKLLKKINLLPIKESELTTIKNFENSTVTPINFVFESTHSSILDFDHSALPKVIESTGIKVHKLLFEGTNKSIEKLNSLGLNNSGVPRFPIYEQLNSSTIKNTLATKTSSDGSVLSSFFSTIKSESTEKIASSTESIYPHFSKANTSFNTHSSEKINNENNFKFLKSEDVSRSSNSTFLRLPKPSFKNVNNHLDLITKFPESKFSTNSFMFTPVKSGDNDISKTVTYFSTPPSFTLFKTVNEKSYYDFTLPTTAAFTGVPVKTELNNQKKETSKTFETEGDNGFEQMTQHNFSSDLDLTTLKTDSIKLISNSSSDANFHSFLANEHGAAPKNNEKHLELFNITNEKLPDDSDFIHITSLTPIFVPNTDSKSSNNHKPDNGFDEKLSARIQGKEKHDLIPHKNRFGNINLENHELKTSDLTYSSRFGSDLVSWIIAFGVLGFFLLSVASGTICVGRYIRQSRRLHGKYNPAKEETAVASTYSMPMTTVSKEERLI